MVNYFTMMAQEIREYMAEIGVRSCMNCWAVPTSMSTKPSSTEIRERHLSPLLHQPDVGADINTKNEEKQIHDIETFSTVTSSPSCSPLQDGEVVTMSTSTTTVAAHHTRQVAKLHGRDGLSEYTINVTMRGIAGQAHLSWHRTDPDR